MTINKTYVNNLNSLKDFQGYYLRTDLTIEKKTFWSWLKRVVFCPKTYNLKKVFEKIVYHNIFNPNHKINFNTDQKFKNLVSRITPKKSLWSGSTYNCNKGLSQNNSRAAQIYNSAKNVGDVLLDASLDDKVLAIFRIALKIKNETKKERCAQFLKTQYLNGGTRFINNPKALLEKNRAAFLFGIAEDFDKLFNDTDVAGSTGLTSAINGVSNTPLYLKRYVIQDTEMYQYLGIQRLINNRGVKWTSPNFERY